MPPKKSQQQQTEVGNEANPTSGTVEDEAQPGTSFSVSPDSSLGILAKMFESFIHITSSRSATVTRCFRSTGMWNCLEQRLCNELSVHAFLTDPLLCDLMAGSNKDSEV
ncbi:hypothetical protein Q5P01_026473 [Channa striata]|uniref:Uncharacterized protein n=1 Tax=Channa striata TaxID=64152 RepID=A0AA88ILC0_CHASR|nr:hypothetical protein Q5P01_026473 [Channa striata]